HGLLAQVMLLLDDSSPEALVVDKAFPPSSRKVHEALVNAWPRLGGRVTFVESDMEAIPLTASDLVISIHACGRLTDVVLQRSVEAGARVAVLPCCHELETSDEGGLSGWMDGPLAIDSTRAFRLKEAGYRIWTQTIPSAITPKNRLLIGAPQSGLA
ncbi:MAG: methyltransferase, partial [Vicinamibacterales bacterium]